jgi:hypothetical protein
VHWQVREAVARADASRSRRRDRRGRC